MTGTETLAVVTSVWGMAMAVSPGMQIRQMLRTGTSQSVSIGYFAVLIVGFMLWVAYGISINSRVIVACNSVATVFGIATVVVAWRLRGAPTGNDDGDDLPESRA